MKRTIITFIALIVSIFIIPGCKKKGCTDPISINYDKDAKEDDGSCMYGGSGGDVTIVAHPQHHGVPITSDSTYLDSAFVKFNATNSPGTSPSAYDMIVVGEPGEDHVHIHGLKSGKYFIYMTGQDRTNSPPAIPFRVFGGIPYTVSVTSGEIELNVPVSEQ